MPLASERSRVIVAASANNAAGHFAASLALIKGALAATPNDPELLLAQASTLFAWRRCREARDSCLRAEALGLRSAALYLHLGWSCFAIGNLDEAETSMRKATAIDLGAWEAQFNLAVVLQAQKQLDEAAANYECALESHPGDFDCHIGLGHCRLAQDHPIAAEAQFRDAIAVDDQRATAWTHLGMAFTRQHRYADALESFTHADLLEEKNGDDDGSFVSLAIGLAEDGRWQEAHTLYQTRLPLRPSVEGHYAYALSLLTAGRFLEGWHHYEFRWLREYLPVLRPELQCPIWAGQDPHGKTILLHAEQGFGDLIQCVRYVPLVKASGATVVLRVSRPMKNLARSFTGVDRILDPDEPLPEFDFYIYLASLPRAFGTDLASIPADIPYLHAEPERVERWAKRLGARDALRVGLVWAGNPQHANDRYRSLPLRMLSPLWGLGGVRFISLQKGAAAAEVEKLPAELDFVNLGPELEDFCDTAAVISELDLVLCVDTAVAHVAGALGKPVWLMLPRPADFRWLEGREDSPWYPTMRLFRQSRRDQWEEVVERVKAALQERLREGVAETRAPAESLAAPRPMLRPPAVVRPGIPAGHRPGFSAVAETRVGILQYLPDEARVGESLGWYGEYLQPQLDLLVRLIRPGATVLEADAGIGAHAVFLGKALGAAGHLFLYEPRPVVQRILRQNLSANRVLNVTLMRRALGRPSTGDIAISGEAASPVVTETLDELQLERLDWLKINEGTLALEVFDGATDTLWRLRPLLFLAAADDRGLMELARRAQAFSYRCWQMETALFNAENFNRREADIFSGRTALALLAIPEEIDVDIALNECVELL
ncbi:MAG TPA: tetratricopeptide repeat protein [Terriglobales bacterium]|nr:tetratricopeptide repeat protein [Terriglobales bacterium]